jgi:DNA excision repair protein ERCC-6
MSSNNEKDDLLTTEEQQVFASMNASVHDVDTYEDDVIRKATHQLAPNLSGVAFPFLHSLAPSYNALRPEQYNPSDAPHFHTMLSRVREQLAAGTNINNTANSASTSITPEQQQNILHLKEQMLLSFMSNVARVPREELPVRTTDERMQEQKRSLALQEPKQQEGDWPETGKSTGTTSGKSQSQQKHGNNSGVPETKKKRARVPMMKRKRDEAEFTDPMNNPDVIRRKQDLRKLRLERKRLKEQRRNALEEGDEESVIMSEEETEFEAIVKAEMDTVEDKLQETSASSIVPKSDEAKVKAEIGIDEDQTQEASTLNIVPEPDQVKVKAEIYIGEEKKEEATNLSIVPESNEVKVKVEMDFEQIQEAPTLSIVPDPVQSHSIQSVACPLCQQVLWTPDPTQTDTVLSHHMDECQPRRSSRRTTRATTADAHGVQPEESVNPGRRALKARATKPKAKKKANKPKLKALPPALDDLEEWVYEDRVDNWIESGLSRMKKMKERDEGDALPGAEDYPGGLWVPAWINDGLFEYQRTGIKWMWDLREQEAGGIVGDEMGLGKTVQVASFLGILGASRKLKSVLVIAPATMLQHWLNELAIWAPGLRRVLIHPSGEVDGLSRTVSANLLNTLATWLRQVRKDRVNEAIDDEDWETGEPHSFCGTGYVVVTTYENIRRNPEIWTRHDWSYCVLDEAQKIRNPDADVTLACKRLRTPHRLALSGTPIQNDLKELWSLFDFVFPGRLGTLPAFEQEFADPIRRGGYSNASPLQVQLAYRCALVLRELINPYLLRRQKKDVKEVARMPGKTEHVLFCRLSQRQRMLYESFLRSDEVTKVIRGSNAMFAAITVLRKICNHADLACDPDKSSFDSFMKNGFVKEADLYGDDDDDDDDFTDSGDEIGNEESLTERSGKLEVLSKILPLWHKQGHRVLIFCQWKKMLNIIQHYTQQQGWKFGRLDGDTNVASRQKLVDEFNADESYFGMLCTTRTGGVGLNLTGANRVILYDPDWNPQTDAQARARAWRFGQEKEVTIYRLITAGTVEEKIYQRQIFKTALSNKVLQDPRQRRLFSQKDLKDLFTLKADTGSVRSGGDGLTETGAATKSVGVVDQEIEPVKETSRDDSETLKSVLKSKGLAGVFDHHFLDPDSSRKSVTVREMEDQAKRVAREAASALSQSMASQKQFTPTWTGSNETAPSRFGASNSSRKGLAAGPGSGSAGLGSSSSLLASLRQRNAAVKSGGATDPPSEEAKNYAKLLSRIKQFVSLRRPSTDQILQEFDSESEHDAAIFRRLLKSVASVEKGRWYLITD